MTDTALKFKISPNWDCILTFDELVKDARFIFSNDGYKGRRPRIVLNTHVNGFDCIEIDYDRYGLITNGVAKFNEQWGQSITDSSKDIPEFIRQFLISEKAEDLIN